MAHIVIVGAGIVGLSVARSAVRRGHEVTILDRDEIPSRQAASFDQHRMIRFHYGAAEGYTSMVSEAFATWEALWADLGIRHFADSGALAISTARNDYSAATETTFQRHGIPYEAVTGAELEQLCSHLQLPPGSRGILARPGGPLFADRIVTDLRRWCETMGVRFIEHSPVVAVEEDGTVVTARGGRLVGDLVVAAAGAWLPGLMPDRFGHLPTYRQALCYVEAPPQHRESWQRAPALVVLGDRNVYSLPPLAGTGLKFGYGPHRRLASPTAGFDWTIDEGRLVIDGFGPFLRDADQYTPLRMQVGYYVMDATRRFRIEQTGRRLCVTNCDGQMFKFGPLVGERIMTAFEGGISAGDLARWAAGELPPHADARHR